MDKKILNGLAEDAVQDIMCMDEAPKNIEEANYLIGEFQTRMLETFK